MVGRRPKLAAETLRPVRESLARRNAEPSLAAWARRLGCSPTTLRAALAGRQKHYRSA